MKTQVISVKKKHIKNGEPENCETCPVALALREAGVNSLLVGSERFFNNTYSTIASAPRSVQRFVASFDAGRKVKPFNFKLKLS